MSALVVLVGLSVGAAAAGSSAGAAAQPRVPHVQGQQAHVTAAAPAGGIATRAQLTAHLAGPDPDARAYAAAGSRRGNKRPNIVLVSADDMTYSDLRWMPHVRRLLGGHGTTFTRAMSPDPLCCPARGAILTGQYGQNNGVKSNQRPYNYVALDAGRALPVWLHRAGYRTAFTGKYLNGFTTHGPRQPGWSYWDATMKGHYRYTRYSMANNGDGRRSKPYRGLNNIDYINGRTVRLVRQWTRQGPRSRPFFIWASHVAPHGTPHSSIPIPPRRYLHKFTHATSPSLLDPSLNYVDEHSSPFVRARVPIGAAKINLVFRRRIQALQGVDEGIRLLVRELRRRHVLDNTYIVFTSDNGFTLGEHRTMTKNLPYTPSTRVPLLVRGPRVRHQVSSERALMIDLAPTFARVANARPLVVQDGTSLLPTLRRGDALRSTVLIQAGPAGQGKSGPDDWWWRGVTTDRYTYARYRGDAFVELYDHATDPFEMHNVAGDARYVEVVAELERRTDVLGACAGAVACGADLGPDPQPLG